MEEKFNDDRLKFEELNEFNYPVDSVLSLNLFRFLYNRESGIVAVDYFP